MTIDLKPGESILIGHDIGDGIGRITLDLGESVTVTAVVAPIRVARSIVIFGTGIRDLVLDPANRSLFHDDDIFLIGKGGANKALISAGTVTAIKAEAAQLRAAFPNNRIGVHYSGRTDAKTVGTAFAGHPIVTISDFNYEGPLGGFYDPGESFSLDPTVVKSHFRQAHDLSAGLTATCSPSGRWYPWSSLTHNGKAAKDLGYKWLPAIYPEHGVIVQTQTWVKDQANGSKRLNEVFAYHRDFIPGVGVQATIGGDTNGTTGPLAIKALNDARAASGWTPPVLSLWWAGDPVGFKAVLAATLNWTVPV